MGCGASTHAQVAQKARGSQQESGGAPVPVAEDARAPEQLIGQTAAGPGVVSDGVTPKGLQGRISGVEAGPANGQQQQDGEARAFNGNGNGNGGLAIALHGTEGPQGSGYEAAADANSNGGGSLLDPAVTPHGGTATVTLGLGGGGGGVGGGGGGGESAAHGFNARSRYTNQSELSMASTSYDLSGRGDSDSEDELEALFTMASWKRFYSYNKKKHHDLLTYFWRKFPPSGYSLWCVSYRYGDLLLAPFMADNVAAGYMARLEELPALAGGGGGGGGGDGGGAHLADEVFCQMYSLHDYEMDEYRVVGLLLAPGSALPTALAALSAFDGFTYLKADSGSTHVKQFVSALLVGKSPLTSLSLLSGREVA
ncbi:hypothetical protein HYH02_007775 [Chlamydomonas schloesseri]|uniref:EF-1-gamma C-terminal domain-containing protein n=1 Tax=Chlamydomonas schloesseri TaxID=2026947 RepID=A0A835WI83_9CHLO|nr:hypothetical protein HYH02_007775 [Chlamydomonas schloesseri]|eukprot:KAG2447450.1 hypothetical protein HYH02_007775 [Chlamydomonas schloesseri]